MENNVRLITRKKFLQEFDEPWSNIVLCTITLGFLYFYGMQEYSCLAERIIQTLICCGYAILFLLSFILLIRARLKISKRKV